MGPRVAKQLYCLLTSVVAGPLYAARDAESVPVGAPCVIAAESMSPDELLKHISKRPIAALILRNGSLADHTAGLANSHNIQLALAPELELPTNGRKVVIDGANERLAFNESAIRPYEPQPIVPTGIPSNFNLLVDGKSAEELSLGIAAGASGVGVLRSEWVGWNSPSPPTADELYDYYIQAVLQAAPHIVNIRLFDIGGDKLPAWCMSQRERLTSPLAARGVRAFNIFPSAYRAQLQAIAQIAQNNRVGVVIPMATDASDVMMVRQELCALASEVQRRQICLGVMVETPSAALTVASLAGEVDFVRIGPGDLSQFTLAQLRHTISPANYSGHGFHPSVTTLISQVVRACSRAEISVSLCLDLDPRDGLLKMLHESGIKSLAVAAPSLKRMLPLRNDQT